MNSNVNEPASSRQATAVELTERTSKEDPMEDVAEPNTASAGGAVRPGWVFALKAAATALAGSLLSLSVAVGQTWYSKRMEMLSRQSEHGAAFQEHILKATGNIENAFVTVLDNLRNGSPSALNEANLMLDGEVSELYNEWRSNVLIMRNRAAEIYGMDVGRLIYDTSEKFYYVDRCNVMVVAGNEDAHQNCNARQRAESRQLNRLLENIQESGERGLAQITRLEPSNIHTNIAATQYVLRRYLNCVRREDSERANDLRCQDLETTLDIIQSRAELLNIARENLANGMMNAAVIAS